MIVREHIPLASLTTLRVGGNARYVIQCDTEPDVREALQFAADKGLPWRVLGGGSNILADDAGYSGVLIHMNINRLATVPDTGRTLLFAGGGVVWDELVQVAALNNLWGVENLAGIPGTVGAAPVQNIGAYGTELQDVLHSVQALNTKTGELETILASECGFGYRESRFKHDRSLIILSIVLALHEEGEAQVAYKDLAAHVAEGGVLSSPMVVGEAVRAIRARKFPDVRMQGTAGSFFKNPVVSTEMFDALRARYPELPHYPQEHGVKIPLAFILDKVLELRGHHEDAVGLFAQQPLVLVTDVGATADAVSRFADDIARRVHDATGITIEREVQSLRV